MNNLRSTVSNARTSDAHRMECMELWGGSDETETSISMTGLRGEILSRAYGTGKRGGDVYYFSSCASGRISRVLLADVTGHGQAVAKTGAVLRDIMRRNVNVIRQSKLIAAMNEEFGQITQTGGFATAVVLTHFSPTNSLTVTIAGHPPPFLYRSSIGRWSRIEEAGNQNSAPSNLPLGIKDAVDYTSTSLEFREGDFLLVYTDAFTEARDAGGNLLGTAGLLRIVNETTTTDHQQLIRHLIGRLESLSDKNLVDDDATAILLQPTGCHIPMKNNLLAPWRMMRGITEVTTPRATT